MYGWMVFSCGFALCNPFRLPPDVIGEHGKFGGGPGLLPDERFHRALCIGENFPCMYIAIFRNGQIGRP